MNEHDRIQEQLAVYKTLSPTVHRQIEQHLGVCPQCADTLAAYQKMDQALHQLTHDKLRVLAAQPMVPPKPRLPLPRSRWREQFTRQPALVLQLTGASVLILLLIMMSLLLAGWQPNEQHLLASTPTVVEPVATATPSNPGVWANQFAVVEADPVEAAAHLADARIQMAEAALTQGHFHWRWDNFVDQTSALPLPRRNDVAPWDAVIVTNDV